MYCENCGNRIDDDSLFCEYCGTMIAPMTPVIPINSQQGITRTNPTESDQSATPNSPLSNAYATANMRRGANKRLRIVLIAAAALIAVLIIASVALYHFVPGIRDHIHNLSFFNGIDREQLAQALLRYDDFDNFSEGLAAVKKNGKWGFINQKGQEAIPCMYDYGPFFNDGRAIVQKDRKNGLINNSGKEVIPCGKYEGSISSMNNGLFSINEGNKVTRLVKKNGKELINRQYDEIGYFYDGIAIAKSSGKYVLVNTKGKEISLEKRYTEVLNFSEGMAAVQINGSRPYEYDENGRWGFIDKKGKEVIPCIYTIVYDDRIYGNDLYFSEGLVGVIKDNKLGFIDKKGQTVVPFKYEPFYMSSSFSEGMAAVCIETGKESHKWGFVDRKGKEVIPCIYDCVDYFSDGMAAVYKSDGYGESKIGFINKQGQLVVPYAYNNGEFNIEGCGGLFFNNGVIALSMNTGEANLYNGYAEGKCGVIDKSNHIIIPFIYDYIGFGTNNYFTCSIFQYDKLAYGIFDNKGNEIVPPVLDGELYHHFEIDFNKNTLVKAKLNNKPGYVDKQGYFITAGKIITPKELRTRRF